jgi:diguanylate cyclase (GGDEF)-like protein
MFHTPDTETLRVCSVLSSTAFGIVFALVRFTDRDERYCLHWSASAFLYAAVLVGFGFTPLHPIVKSALLGALAATNMLIVSGLRAFDRRPAFRWWMTLPISGSVLTHLLPSMVVPTFSRAVFITQIGDTLSIAISALIVGIACLTRAQSNSRATNANMITLPTRGRRLAGLAMMGYMPGYAITLVGYLSNDSSRNLLALIPMLSDQLLLAILNLGLLAMPAERAAQRLRDAALRDPLTGVWNRAGFDAVARPVTAIGATVLAIDVDHFKAINDQYGHADGDKVLSALAHVATAEIESLGGVFGRLGGDEFVAILPASRAPYAQACARQIHDACRRRAEMMNEWTISIGLSQVEYGEVDMVPALHRADRALYRAKVNGRDNVFV